MNKTLLRTLTAAGVLLSPVLAAAPTQTVHAQAAPVEFNVEVARVVSATASSVTFQVVAVLPNQLPPYVPAVRSGPDTFTAALPRADRSKPVLAKNAAIMVHGTLSRSKVVLGKVTRLGGKCGISPAPYKVVVCKTKNVFHARWTGNPYPIPSTTRGACKCMHFIALMRPDGTGHAISLDQAYAGAQVGTDNTAKVELSVSRSCHTSQVLATIGTLTFR
jgi:hypothetical protein